MDDYRGYLPDFLEQIKKGDRGGPLRGWRANPRQMELSREKSFYSSNIVAQDDRSLVLVEAGIHKEKLGAYREALSLYRKLLEQILKQDPELLYRVSEYGVFVPISQYVQRRILNFPKPDLDFYRVLMDPVAREAFQVARRKYSREGFAEIVDRYLATSYGDNAIFELGNAELDAGHFQSALDYYSTLRDFFPDSDCRTPELFLKIAYCRKLLGLRAEPPPAGPERNGTGSDETLRLLERAVESASFSPPTLLEQRHSAPYEATDDYVPQALPKDLLAVEEPQWKVQLPGSWRENNVFTQPVATSNSIVYRHQNILYCHSLLTGELRWKSDLGGRSVWQNRDERMYPQEDILVQNGMLYAPMHKIGPSLVALDEVSGALQWAYGPLAASSEEEAHMRFESAPAGGLQAVFATYILDHLEGSTHTDTEYGVLAFEARSGRVRWRACLCRLPPGAFSSGNKGVRRNRIRSFSSPPLYHQGRVYVCTNAGVIAALDALSGRVQWLMRYPCTPEVHDATTAYGRVYDGVFTDRSWLPHDPMFWFGQRPLIVGDRLFITPVDSKLFLALDRRSGKVLWSRPKKSPAYAYLLGAISTSELVFAHSGRSVELVDPASGQTTWETDDLVAEATEPLLRHVIPFTILDLKRPHGIFLNERYFGLGARPFLAADDKLCVTGWTDLGIYYTMAEGWWPDLNVYHLAWVDLKNRKVLERRRYFSDRFKIFCKYYQEEYGPRMLKGLQKIPDKTEPLGEKQRILREVVEDAKPFNSYGAFRPFSRLTFRRYGTPFELRCGPREVAVSYDPEALRRGLDEATGAEGEFGRGELALSAGRLEEAVQLFDRCLKSMSSEDLDFRARVNQQLYLVHKRLACGAIRRGDREGELRHALGMSQTGSTLADEVETLFSLSEAYERQGDRAAAARLLRSIIERHGRDPYEVAAAANNNPAQIMAGCREALDAFEKEITNPFFEREVARGLKILKGGLPIYFSALSPLARDYTIRAGELAAARLARLQMENEEVRKEFETQAAAALKDRPVEEQISRLWEFPATQTAQEVLDGLFRTQAGLTKAEAPKRLWELADVARISGLRVPEAYRAVVGDVPQAVPEPSLALPVEARAEELEGGEAVDWLVLERSGDRGTQPSLAFWGGRIKKRSDNKFVLRCKNLESGKDLWEVRDLRLKGKGDEPGFFEAYVHENLVVVHGLYDVLAFGLEDGVAQWHYRVPFDFEIKHAVQSGAILVLCGAAESVALHLPTGEVAWQMKERGDPYIPSYFDGERYVTVRKFPFNVTVRFRVTGTLIGSLDLPDLSLHDAHPMLRDGPRALPAAHQGSLLALSDERYYLLLDTRELSVKWKRPIDAREAAEPPALRFALTADHLFVLKRDYDQIAFYALSTRSGEIAWTSAPTHTKDVSQGEPEAEKPAVESGGGGEERIRPMHSFFVAGKALYGIESHAGNGFYFVGRNVQDGKLLLRREAANYSQRPEVELLPRAYGRHGVVVVRDLQDFEVRAVDLQTGESSAVLKKKGTGNWGVHGQQSCTAQAGRIVFLSKYDLSR